MQPCQQRLQARHIDRPELAGALHDALMECLEEGRRTADLGGSLGTRAFTDAVADALVKRL